jgi:hypothetical protein
MSRDFKQIEREIVQAARWSVKWRMFQNEALVLLRHKLHRERPFIFPAQHGQRKSLATSSIISRRRRVAMEFGTWRSGRSGGASGSVTFG